MGVPELDDSTIRDACGLFDGPRRIGLAEASGAPHAPDGDGDRVDLAARFEPFRMRAA